MLRPPACYCLSPQLPFAHSLLLGRALAERVLAAGSGPPFMLSLYFPGLWPRERHRLPLYLILVTHRSALVRIRGWQNKMTHPSSQL